MPPQCRHLLTAWSPPPAPTAGLLDPTDHPLHLAPRLAVAELAASRSPALGTANLAATHGAPAHSLSQESATNPSANRFQLLADDDNDIDDDGRVDTDQSFESRVSTKDSAAPANKPSARGSVPVDPSHCAKLACKAAALEFEHIQWEHACAVAAMEQEQAALQEAIA